MKVIAKRVEETVVCTLPQGLEIEIIMISAEGEEYHAEPDLHSAPGIIEELGRSTDTHFHSMLAAG